MFFRRARDWNPNAYRQQDVVVDSSCETVCVLELWPRDVVLQLSTNRYAFARIQTRVHAGSEHECRRRIGRCVGPRTTGTVYIPDTGAKLPAHRAILIRF